jgi:hypothetical protein
VDEEFNLLYASKNFTYICNKPIEEMIGGKCWNIMDNKIVECSQLTDGRPSCPVSRALETNKFHNAVLEYHDHGESLYFNSYAVPIEMEDTNGEPFKCCMGILFDITKEKQVQLNFEEDLKHIISTLYNLVAEMELTASGKTNEILEEAKSFNDYLNIIKSQLETHQNI